MLLGFNAPDVRCRYRQPHVDDDPRRGHGDREERVLGPTAERTAGNRLALNRSDVTGSGLNVGLHALN